MLLVEGLREGRRRGAVDELPAEIGLDGLEVGSDNQLIQPCEKRRIGNVQIGDARRAVSERKVLQLIAGASSCRVATVIM